MEMFCRDLRDHAREIINYEKKEMIPLTNEVNEFYKNHKVSYICKKENYFKVRDHCHYKGQFRGATHSICNLRYKIPEEIPVVFHNGSTNDYHLIIKQLPKEFEGKFEWLGKNTKKYITFSVPIKKKLDNNKTITYRLKSLLIVLDLCQPHYQVLLITYLKFTKKNAKDARKEEKSNQYAILLVLKIIN